MQVPFSLAQESLGYQTNTDPSNTDKRLLIAGSQNVLIDQQKKVRSRPGYTRLGPANTNLTPPKSAWRWDTSTALKLPQRFYNGTLEAYLRTIDGVAINAWTQIYAGFTTTGRLRPAYQGGIVTPWYDSTEGIDLQPMVQGDDSIFEWNGAIAVVDSSQSAVGVIVAFNSTPTAGGSGYVAGDILTITTGGTGAQVTVVTVDGSGAVTAVSILHRGVGYTTGTGKATSGGSGTGCTVNISTVGAGSITKKGTTTYAQNRFYHTRAKIVKCVRTGTEYTYLDDGSTLEIGGMGDTSTLVSGDILVQKVVQQTTKPAAGRKNDVAYVFQNQLVLGSYSDPQAYISKNSSYYDFAFSSPRISGEGGLLTMDNPTRAINSLGVYLLVFAGSDSIFRADYTQITVSTTLAETLRVQKFDVGTNKGALNQESTVSVGNQIAYLTNEVSLRTIDNVQNLTGINPKTLSQPIQPDFDAEDWTNACGIFYKNTLEYAAPVSGKLYMLNFTQDSNGRLFRYWNPPQLLPLGPLVIFDAGDGEFLYGHSNAVPETYKLFDGLSDGQYVNMNVGDKIAIHAIGKYAYDNMGKRDQLKTFDEYAVDGEISPNTTDLELNLDYNFDGYTQIVQKNINGTDEDILEGNVINNSLAESLLAQQPLGGLLTPPTGARRFRVVFEIAREDFFELSATFETNDVDRYWSIVSHGPNATMSPRRPINIRK